MSPPTPTVIGIPQQTQSMSQPMVQRRRLNGLTIVGAILVLVGLSLTSIMYFQMAALTYSYYGDYRWIYVAGGIGTVLEGVGLFLAFLGLASGYRL